MGKYNIGDKFVNDDGLEFEIVEFFMKQGKKRKHLRAIVRFTDSGNLKEIAPYNIGRHNIVDGKRNDYEIGQILTNNVNQKFQIIDYGYDEQGKISGRIIKFLETGTVKKVCAWSLKQRSVRDDATNQQPIILEDGTITRPWYHYLWSRWKHMMDRCYNPNYPGYKTYGAKGIYVVDEWHKFENYVRDIESLPNAEKLKEKDERWTIDKDLSKKGYYGKDSVCIITLLDNVKERNERCGLPKKIGKF